MGKFLVVNDFDLTEIGSKFELEEVRDNVDKVTGEIIGHYYDVKVLDGKFKKKHLTVRVDGYNRSITNEMIVNCNQLIVNFEDMKVSSVQPRRLEGLRVFYVASKVNIVEVVHDD
ncbi:hypothetical protein N1495_01355 [Streptococcus didelphis]|uniref:Uncharacterized protein n=1 Tax=Streptococcus didelphis TaxID=102886 RepID=A0ABY9LG10_9STRE|nr:hypothetical protein [Streptococcus didelphis]WMB27845.1 hypothetical protein N1496_07255 [Streptococcus didelphis]WMB29693.1 hypothetical protein N1495_01355 [Streptococcus didelphis]